MTETVDIPVEYRLYYDDRGDPTVYVSGCFTIDEPGPEGKYIVIDQYQYLCRRFDIKVVGGKVLPRYTSAIICKLVHKEGITCTIEDISIPVNNEYKGRTNQWGIKLYERTDS
jgi:hypothetical protein